MLVLGAGGILGEAWMNALLAGLEESGGFDARGCSGFVGTSAGSIVAAALAAGVRPGERLGRLPEQPPAGTNGSDPSGGGGAGRGGDGNSQRGSGRRGLGAAAALGVSAAGPLAALALNASAPGGALVRRVALARIPRGRRSLSELARELDRIGLRWDGRLRVAAVELESGRRVAFGTEGAPEVSVSQAVSASCAIPGVFRPLEHRGRSYVDGGAWSLTNMDLADAARGDHVLCLNPTGATGASFTSPASALAPVSRSVAAAEALVLRGRGASVETVNPDRASTAAMGPNLMDPRPRAAVIAAGLAQGRRLGANRHAPARES